MRAPTLRTSLCTALLLVAAQLAAPGARALEVVLVPGSNPLVGAELANLERAAEHWSNMIGGTHTVTITHEKATLPAGRLGQASNMLTAAIGNSGLPVSATVTITDAVPFFVDPTPGDHSEFLHNVSPPYLRPADPLGPAFGSYDLLTLCIHEVGHAVGFSSSYADFASFIQLAPSGIEYVYVFQNVPLLLDPIADYFAGFFIHGGVYMPLGEDDTEEGGSVGGLPSHFQDVWQGNLNAASLAVDVMHPTQNPSERILIGEPDIDVLSDAFGLPLPVRPLPMLAAPAALALLFGVAISGALALRARQQGAL